MARNPGPLLTTTKRSLLEVIPERFRSALTYTERAVNLTETPSSLSFTKIMSEVVHEHINERRKREWTLVGSAFPTLYGADYDSETNLNVPYVETIVPMAAVTGGSGVVEYTPLSEYHQLRKEWTTTDLTKTVTLPGMIARWNSPPIAPDASLYEYGPFTSEGSSGLLGFPEDEWQYTSISQAKAYALSYSVKEGAFPATLYIVYKEPTGGHGLSYPYLNFTMQQTEENTGYISTETLSLSQSSGYANLNPAIASVTIPAHIGSMPSGNYIVDASASDYKWGIWKFQVLVIHL